MWGLLAKAKIDALERDVEKATFEPVRNGPFRDFKHKWALLMGFELAMSGGSMSS